MDGGPAQHRDPLQREATPGRLRVEARRAVRAVDPDRDVRRVGERGGERVQRPRERYARGREDEVPPPEVRLRGRADDRHAVLLHDLRALEREQHHVRAEAERSNGHDHQTSSETLAPTVPKWCRTTR